MGGCSGWRQMPASHDRSRRLTGELNAIDTVEAARDAHEGQVPTMVDVTTQSPDEPGAVGSAAGGWVRVELDTAGRVRDVSLDPRAMTMTAAALGDALATAFRQAQDTVRAQADEMAARYHGLPSPERLQAAAEEATAAAERRFEEISSVLYDLDRRAGSQW